MNGNETVCSSSSSECAKYLRLKTFPYYVKACALGIPAYLIGVHLWTWVLTVSVFICGRADFRQLYVAGYMVRTGHARQLYDYDIQKEFQNQLVSHAELALPFVRPAYQAICFAPITVFSYRTAYFVFLSINVVLLSTSFLWLRPRLQTLHSIYKWLPTALFLAFLPVAAALIQGQDSIILLTLLTGAFVFLGSEREFAAGSLVGLGLFKFQLVLPIGLLFLLWRRWRFVRGFTLIVTALSVSSMKIVGLEQSRLYVQSLFSIGGVTSAEANLLHYPVPLGTMANVHGFLFGVSAGRLPRFWLQLISFCLSSAVVGWTAFRGRRNQNASNLLLLALPCGVLVSHYCFIHDLSILLLPCLLILDRFLPFEMCDSHKGRFIARSAVLMFVAPLAESYLPSHFYVVTIAIFIFWLAMIAAEVLSFEECP
jgi:hypothetical protein